MSGNVSEEYYEEGGDLYEYELNDREVIERIEKRLAKASDVIA